MSESENVSPDGGVTDFELCRQRSSDGSEKHLEWKTLLHTAMESTSHGLCIFDSRLRLVISNNQLREMYALSSPQIVPGLPLKEVLKSRLARLSDNTIVGDRLVEYLAAIQRKQPFQTQCELRDGTFIAVDSNPMSDGGVVEIHRDVTELRLAEIRAEETRQELIEKQYALDQAVIVAITDLRGTITQANEKFCEISGYSREELVGNNHRILKSGMHSREFFREMYRCLGKGNVWRGEVCNKSKSGALYWVDTVITPQLGPEGKPIAYMAIRIDITARKRAEAQIYHAARHDALTGLLNRAALLNGLAERLCESRMKGQKPIVYMLDLDGFKYVNDTLGHAAGDVLLKEVGRRLKSLVSVDDLVARLGGDEFAIVQAASEDQRERAIKLAVGLLEIIGRPFRVDTQEVSVGVSIGISLAPIDGLTASELLHKADLALYRVKSEGRNGFHLFEEEMSKHALCRNRLVNDLRASVVRGEFELHYQPIFQARSLRPLEMEALVRWRHPSEGLLYPDRFIGIAEETGLMESLGHWILQRACADALSWPEEIKVAVNLSPTQFRGTTLFDVILCVLVETGLAPHRLELEITESLLLQDKEENLQLFRQLKNIGISIALDDFGVGYASLASIVSFPFDKVKIDRSFTQGLLSNRANKAVVASIMTLASGLSVQVTAEGVETAPQLEYLRLQGVDLVQGYLLGKPAPNGELDLRGPPLRLSGQMAGRGEREA